MQVLTVIFKVVGRIYNYTKEIFSDKHYNTILSNYTVIK